MSSSTRGFFIASENLKKKQKAEAENQARKLKKIENSLAEGQCFKALVLSCFALFDTSQNEDKPEGNNNSQGRNEQKSNML